MTKKLIVILLATVVLFCFAVPCFASSTDYVEERTVLPYAICPLGVDVSYTDISGNRSFANWSGFTPLEVGQLSITSPSATISVSEQARITGGLTGAPFKSSNYRLLNDSLDVSERDVDVSNSYTFNLQDGYAEFDSYSVSFGRFIFDGVDTFDSVSDSELSFEYRAMGNGVKIVTTVSISGVGYNNLGESYVYDEQFSKTTTYALGSTFGELNVSPIALAQQALSNINPFPYQLLVDELKISLEFADIEGEPLACTSLADYWHFDLVPLEDSYLEVNSRFESIMRGANSILDYDFFSWFESVADS
ncbi:MAG: hypothetical protein IJ301_04385, partial [Clostridia bacterium]|nr:hypothetical protein [Clostridia bacterium]